MPTYNVHCYAVVRVLVPGVEAESHVEAARIAAQAFDWDNPRFGAAREFADVFDGFLVDVAGSEDFSDSRNFTGDFQESPEARPDDGRKPFTVVGLWYESGDSWVEHAEANDWQSAVTSALDYLAACEGVTGDTEAERLDEIRSQTTVAAVFPGKLMSLV